MGTLFLVHYLEFARSFEGNPEGATPESIAAWLQRNWLTKRGGGNWNYDPAMEVLVLAFAGHITLEQAIEHCHRYWHPHARVENERVVRCFWRYAVGNKSRVYRRSYFAAPVGRWRGRNIFIGVKAPLVRVSNDEVLAVVPIFRKNFTPCEKETDLSLTIVREFSLREGYRDIDTEYLRARGVDGSLDRRLIVDRGSHRRLYSSEQLDTFAQKYAKAVSLLADAGLGLEQPNFAGYRIWDPDQPPFPGI